MECRTETKQNKTKTNEKVQEFMIYVQFNKKGRKNPEPNN